MKSLTIALLVTASNLAYGQQVEPQVEPAGGVYLRGQLGVMGLSAADESASLSGGGMDLSVAIGYRAVTGWVFYGELFGAATSGIDASAEGQSASCDDCSLMLGSALLPGVGTGYYTPSGLNLLLSVHAPNMSADIEGDTSTSDRGVVAFFTAGKDWPVGDSVGLGVAARLGVGSIEDVGVGFFSLSFAGSYR